jgi:hypothetical protein
MSPTVNPDDVINVGPELKLIPSERWPGGRGVMLQKPTGQIVLPIAVFRELVRAAKAGELDHVLTQYGDGRTEEREHADDSAWIQEGVRKAFPEESTT